MTDDALTRTRRALQVVPSRAGAVAPVDTAKVNDLLARVREATRKPPSLRSGLAGRPSLPVASEPGKALTTIEPSRPSAKARELRPASLALRRGGQVPANRPPASSPEVAMLDRQPNEPSPAVPAPPVPDAGGPQTVYVPVPTPVWGFYPWGWGWPGPWGCLAVNCPLLRGKRCRPCGL